MTALPSDRAGRASPRAGARLGHSATIPSAAICDEAVDRAGAQLFAQWGRSGCSHLTPQGDAGKLIRRALEAAFPDITKGTGNG